MDKNEPPASVEEKSSLVRILKDYIRMSDDSVKQISIKVTKYPEPILNPYDKKFEEKYTSIRNPGGTIHNKEILLLPTIRHKQDNKSRIHIARSKDGINFKLEERVFIDVDPDSLLGVEDARITKIEDEYFITFTAFKETDAQTYNTTRIGIVKTKDFKTMSKRKILLDQWGNNKNCVLVKPLNSKYFYVIHRPFLGKKDEKEKSYIAKTEDFETFENLGIFMEARDGWESARIGVNSPEADGLMLYHGAEKITNRYCMGAILVDKHNPKNILWRSDTPLIEPELWWEKNGKENGAEVPNVVFGCNLIKLGNKYITYYAGADRYTGKADIEIEIQ